ncbi:MAG TPA: biopolymer transporter ExbD [Chthoniobacterales bacterium]|jgi:biopolymer transport protein ExbD
MPEEDPEFQIAPMIDILLVLLVFFMSISSTQVLQSNEQVQLPIAAKAKDPGENTEAGQAILNVLWVPLGGVGQIQYNEVTVGDANSIIGPLQDSIKKNPKLRVIIRADRRAPYSFVRPLLVAVGKAGSTNITFSVVNKDEDK